MKKLSLMITLALIAQAPASAASAFKTYLPEPVKQFDPIYMSSPAEKQISHLLHQGLVKYSENLLPPRYGSFSQVVPALAKSWQEGTDHKSYIFKLNPEARFHNGRSITAADVKYSLERACNPRLNSEGLWAINRLNIQGLQNYQIAQLNGVKDPHLPGIEVLDDSMVKITLEDPVPYALDLLTLPYFSILPREAVDRRWKPYNEAPVGAGPYVFKSLNDKNQLELATFPQYYEAGVGKVGLSFSVIPSTDATFDAFRANHLDHTSVPTPFFKKVIEDPIWNPLGDTWILKAQKVVNTNQTRVIKMPQWTTHYLNMDHRFLPFDNVKVRQAFNYAVDKREITRSILSTYARPVSGVYPPDFPGSDGGDFIYQQNQDKARKLLYEAGWRDKNHDGFVTPWQNPNLNLTLYYQSNENSYKICRQVQSDLAKVGVKINIAPQSNTASPIFYHTSTAPLLTDASQLFFKHFYSHSPANRSHYYNPMVDQQLATAEQIYDQPERHRLYQKAERHIIEDAPWLWLYHPVDYMMVQPSVMDYRFHPLLQWPYQLFQVASKPNS